MLCNIVAPCNNNIPSHIAYYGRDIGYLKVEYNIGVHNKSKKLFHKKMIVNLYLYYYIKHLSCGLHKKLR